MSASSPLRVSLVQTSLVWENPTANFKQLSQVLAPLAGSDLIILPEAFSTGFTMNGRALGAGVGEQSLAFLQKQAAELDSAICGSTFYHEQEDSVVNKCIFVTPSGKTDHYHKRHRFTLAGEHKAYGPGHDRPVIVEYKGWRILLQVCYDLRFPVFSRNRAGDASYDMAIYIANWPAKRREHWRTLLRARAIENQAYVVGVNIIGEDGTGLAYAGDSMVIDPLGAIEIDLAAAQTAVTLSLKHEKVRATREALPFLKDGDDFRLV